MPKSPQEINTELLLALAHDLIGVHGIYQGREYTLIEVLDSGPSVVLEPVQTDTVIQNTFQGEAKRFAQSNYTVPFYSEVRQNLHPVVQEFLGPDIAKVLHEQLS
jgi:hypothetical protein